MYFVGILGNPSGFSSLPTLFPCEPFSHSGQRTKLSLSLGFKNRAWSLDSIFLLILLCFKMRGSKYLCNIHSGDS